MWKCMKHLHKTIWRYSSCVRGSMHLGKGQLGGKCERQVPMITCKQLCQKAIMPGYWHNPRTLFKQQLVTYSLTIAMVCDSISPLGTTVMTSQQVSQACLWLPPSTLITVWHSRPPWWHPSSCKPGSWGPCDYNNPPKLLHTCGFEPLTWSTWHTVKDKFQQ